MANQLLTPGYAWSDRVLHDIASFEKAEQVAWYELLHLGLTTQGAKPSKRWLEVADEALHTLKPEHVQAVFVAWLEPTVTAGVSAIATDNQDCFKGLLWAMSLFSDHVLAHTLLQLINRFSQENEADIPRALCNAAIVAIAQMNASVALPILQKLRESHTDRRITNPVDRHIENLNAIQKPAQYSAEDEAPVQITEQEIDALKGHVLVERALARLTQKQQWKFQGTWRKTADINCYLQFRELSIWVALHLDETDYHNKGNALLRIADLCFYCSNPKKTKEQRKLKTVPSYVYSKTFSDLNLFIEVASFAKNEDLVDIEDAELHDMWLKYQHKNNYEQQISATKCVLIEQLKTSSIVNISGINAPYLYLNGRDHTYHIHLISGLVFSGPIKKIFNQTPENIRLNTTPRILTSAIKTPKKILQVAVSLIEFESMNPPQFNGHF